MQTVEKKGGICSKLTINMLGGNDWLYSVVFLINFEQYSCFVLMILLLTIN